MKLFFALLFAIYLDDNFLLAVEHGRNVNIRDVPYYASVFEYGRFICGAVIVGQRWVLTAKHCVPDYTSAVKPEDYVQFASRLTIRTGTSQFHDDKERYAVETYDYPRPDNNNKVPDIALIKLKDRIIFDSFQKSISIACAANTKLEYGQPIIISGFGLNENGTQPTNLQQMSVTIATVHDTIFTTGLDGIHRTNCGDSGSPVVYDGILIGIATVTNRAPNKIIAGHPVVSLDNHLSVDLHATWIQSITGGEVVEKCSNWQVA